MIVLMIPITANVVAIIFFLCFAAISASNSNYDCNSNCYNDNDDKGHDDGGGSDNVNKET